MPRNMFMGCVQPEFRAKAAVSRTGWSQQGPSEGLLAKKNTLQRMQRKPTTAVPTAVRGQNGHSDSPDHYIRDRMVHRRQLRLHPGHAHERGLINKSERAWRLQGSLGWPPRDPEGGPCHASLKGRNRTSESTPLAPNTPAGVPESAVGEARRLVPPHRALLRPDLRFLARRRGTPCSNSSVGRAAGARARACSILFCIHRSSAARPFMSGSLGVARQKERKPCGRQETRGTYCFIAPQAPACGGHRQAHLFVASGPRLSLLAHVGGEPQGPALQSVWGE